MSEIPKGLDWKAFTPDDSPKTPMDVWADPRLVDLSVPDLKTGDLAFDFELPIYDYSDGTRQATNETFHLSSEASKRPVALVFGSYT
jgi:hypothetical protein